MSSTKFKRSNKDRMVAGVCGGLGNYLGIDSTLIRLGFVILAIASGIGIPFYILLMIIAPSETDFEDIEIHFPGEREPTAVVAEKRFLPEPTGDKNRLIAYGLIGFGTVMVLSQFGWVSMSVLLPLFIIGLGVYMVINRQQ